MLRLLGLETRLLFREPVALLILLIALSACAVAVVNGRTLLQAQQAGRAASAAEDAETDTAFRAGLVAPDVKPEDAVLRPVRVSLPVMAPLPPLMDFSAGRASFENYSTVVRVRSRGDSLFKRTQLDNPELLARGSLDLGFVAVVIAPLLLIGIGYGLFAADRDSGAARLVLAQAGSPMSLLTARSLPRLALVAAPLVLAAVVLVSSGPDLPGRSLAAGLWLLLAALVMLFWWSVILFVNSFKTSAEMAALTLVGLWAGLTLILPALIAAVAQVIHPPPSRFEQIATARVAEIASTTSYENDHPDLVRDDAAARLESVRKSYRVGTAVEAAVDPLSRAFDEQLARQQAVIRAFSYASPPLVAGEALTDVAGTGSRSALAFRTATRAYLADFKRALGGYIESGAPLTLNDYERLPRFRASAAPSPPWESVLALLALTLAFAGVASRRLARVRLD